MRSRLVHAFLAGITLATYLQAAADTNEIAPPSASVYRNIAGRDLRLFTFSPTDHVDTARPAILMVQGGAWSRGSPDQLFRPAQYFFENGFVPVVAEYRLADATNSPVESFSDVCHALAFLRKNAERFGVAPSRIAVWGISSSGQLVASAATVGCSSTEGSAGNGGPDAILLVSPVVDAISDGLFRRLMRGHGDPAFFSPTHTLMRSIVPALITQGDADQTTPIERSRAFCERAQRLGSRCELVAFEGEGHVLDRATRDRVLDLQITFLRKIWQ
jgi:acetyl esterase